LSRVILYLSLALIILTSCNENNFHDKNPRCLEDFSKLNDKKYSISDQAVREHISRLIKDDGVLISADRQVIRYYAENKPFIWINRLGIHNRADTLLKIIQKADLYGFSTRMLKVSQIEKDLNIIKSLNVSDGNDNINIILARLEYNLTKALLRYSTGLRFGMVNPDYLYNNLEKYEVDSTSTKFRQLSDLRIERPNNEFYSKVITQAMNDSIVDLFATILPQNDLYEKLIQHLNRNGLTYEEKVKTICNIERCRWRLKILSGQKKFNKYVEVNIPSFLLRAINNNDILTMRVGCGTTQYKTPLLTSKITRMDINPQWIIPKSISKGYVGNHQYMHKMGMFVYDKKLGKLPPEEASYNKVMNGEQYIIQAGGPKNSLGRIIFRFNNNFSVFLHDTSSPWLFQRTNRAVSHGCIRVEKPYELALFLLNERNEKLQEKLEYSMTVELVNDNDSLRKSKIDRSRMINSVSVNPSIPLFVTYYTKYWDENGRLADYQDIYGYDEVLYNKLKPFVE